MGAAADLTRLYDTIPDPDTIRSRLAELAREQALLRSLLRIAMKKARALGGEKALLAAEVAHGR
jgi:hypothetical protein